MLVLKFFPGSLTKSEAKKSFRQRRLDDDGSQKATASRLMRFKYIWAFHIFQDQLGRRNIKYGWNLRSAEQNTNNCLLHAMARAKSSAISAAKTSGMIHVRLSIKQAVTWESAVW